MSTRPKTARSNKTRLLNAPDDGLKRLCRVDTVMAITQGKTEDEVYSWVIGRVVRSARSQGCDESNVEVLAAMARKAVAATLAECRAAGHHPGGR